MVCSEPEDPREAQASRPALAAVGPSDRSTFEAVGGSVKRTASALSYVPSSIGKRVLKPGQTDLRLIVNHSRLNRKIAPRKPDEIAELEAIIAA